VIDALRQQVEHRLVIRHRHGDADVDRVSRGMLQAVEGEMIAVPGEAEPLLPAGDLRHVRGVEVVRAADRQADAVADDRLPLRHPGEVGDAVAVLPVAF